jgi:cystathionine gamma-synthase
MSFLMMPTTHETESTPCRPEDLGRPIPASAHAVSVALPRWQDVVGYEEKKPEVLERLSSGYPRFVVHALVNELAQRLAGRRPCLPFPSARTARLAADFVRRNSGENAELVSKRGVNGVAVNSAKGEGALREFWQHAGLIVSSREAEAHLASRTASPDSEAARQALRRQLAGLYDCAESDVFLGPTGMASVFTALRALNRRAPGLRTVQLGFPYVDTLKLQEKVGHGAVLVHDVSEAEGNLAALLQKEKLGAVFCEIPGNPLLTSPDLPRLSALLRQHGIPLVVDDVVATPVNVNLAPYADLIVTSLTKFFLGSGDAMGGALICNPRSPLFNELKSLVRDEHEELLWGDDALVLEEGGRDFVSRMKRHNENGLLIAERLRAHPAIERVWYPRWESAEAYESVRRADGGWGALLSFVPKRAQETAPRIYDALRICKGPSLGTVFTLACPFTLLAHYQELDWAESCGVSRYLIRLSVGLEDPEQIWKRLESALGAVG